MANYTIMNDSPQYTAAADVVVYYDNTPKKQKFLVTTTDTGVGGYAVSIDELFGNEYKYPSEVFSGILSEILPDAGDFLVLFTNRAMNAVNLVCQGNRLTF